MAEYVRRRRPPASHPYWDRLHDRAHPPAVLTPIIAPACLGLAIGLIGGLRSSFSIGDAFKLATTSAGVCAAIMFAIMAPILVVESARQGNRQERWTAALVGATLIGVIVFVVSLIPLFPLFLWYAACSGQGPWLGMLIGLLIGTIPGVLYARWRRHWWHKRQQQWPRWERMRVPRSDATLNVTPMPAPLEPLSPEGATANSPGREPLDPGASPWNPKAEVDPQCYCARPFGAGC